MPHDFEGVTETSQVCARCGQGPRGTLHDGVKGESRLHQAREACKHPSETWQLKGQTKKRAGTYYCPCGERMSDNGPRDLAARLRF